MNAFSKRNEIPISQFHQGGNFHSYELLGTKAAKRKGASGVLFRVWAPHAKSVSVVGDFNSWERSAHPMERQTESGLWEGFVPALKQGDKYQFSMEAQNGDILLKNDPYTYSMKEGVSAYCDISRFNWKDDDWMQRRKLQKHHSEAMNIYEVHPGTWKQNEDGSVLNYRKLADELLPYVVDMGYTHIQLLPLMEHPAESANGDYDVSAYFAPSSRYGAPKDLMYLVNKCHEKNIGVIFDWVPGHFPKGPQGLECFDGQLCYEYDSEQWNCCIFDFSKPEVQSFLISNAFYWIEQYHADGLRVDAVSAMLYLDYSKEQWQRRENPASLDFLKRMNNAILGEHPDVMMFAEESSAWPMITKPTYAGGLGFHFKWNSGWSHDMLQYMALDPIYRAYNHDKLTFSLMYAFSEHFVLPLSHDEVSEGKGSLISQMPGDHNQKFAALKAFFGYTMAHPGKKLLFMGGEFGQFIEWSPTQPLDWQLLDFDSHRKLKQFVKDLNHFYLDNSPLWEIDNSWDGFQWLVHDDHSQSVVAFRRTDEDGEDIIAICNFTGNRREGYRMGVPQQKDYEIAFSSDELKYGGSGMIQPEVIPAQSSPMHGKPFSITVDIPPMSCLFLKAAKPAQAVLDAVIPD